VLEGTGYPPAHGGTAIVNGEPFDAMFFKQYGTNPFVDTEDDSLSTFAIDVDDASYIMTRSYLERGHLPPDEAVRTEEFINHFKYNYPLPERGPFSIHFEGAPSRFGQNCRLLKIGIRGSSIAPDKRKDANLVFVIDVSGSMGREDRLGLVRKSLRMLVDNLNVNDRVGIVVYGSRGKVILEPTSIERRHDILSAIEWLRPEGSTNADEGLRLGYDMAERMFEPGKINRIILCSDGVANVGLTSAEDLLERIKRYAEKGITLTTVGFGMGNYNDILMEKLGNKGNGFYAYVDDFAEAKRIFMENLTGTLQVIARDVKIQVDFDPQVVRSYRLLGYENRDVDDDKFRDDKEDGGEIGSGHQVTALYEIKFFKDNKTDRIGTMYIRYKDPDNGSVSELSRDITRGDFRNKFESCSADFKLAAAAAELAEILRKSYWAKGSQLSDVYDLAKEVFLENDSQEMVEFLNMISKADKFSDERAEK
jgi:Ca-activated chloride channel family protein